MILTETKNSFPLDSVKPLEDLQAYRTFCLESLKEKMSLGGVHRTQSPVGSQPLERVGDVDGFPYARCPETGSLFLADVPAAKEWSELLSMVAQRRQNPDGIHNEILNTRTAHVFQPKLSWVESSLRFQGIKTPSLAHVCTSPSFFSSVLKSGSFIQHVDEVDEMKLTAGEARLSPQTDAVLLMESLDRVLDPASLVQKIWDNLKPGGLLFVTSLVSSGFDMVVLGLKNFYFYPPDRANAFSLSGLKKLLTQVGFQLHEVSTPGVLDLEIVKAHLSKDPDLRVSDFERQILREEEPVQTAFQSFLQQSGRSSYARIVGRKP